MPMMVVAVPSRNQEPGTPPSFPIWVAGAQVFGPSSTTWPIRMWISSLSPGESAGSWNASGANILTQADEPAGHWHYFQTKNLTPWYYLLGGKSTIVKNVYLYSWKWFKIKTHHKDTFNYERLGSQMGIWKSLLISIVHCNKLSICSFSYTLQEHNV